jgi:hypothetical protein
VCDCLCRAAKKEAIKEGDKFVLHALDHYEVRGTKAPQDKECPVQDLAYGAQVKSGVRSLGKGDVGGSVVSNGSCVGVSVAVVLVRAIVVALLAVTL